MLWVKSGTVDQRVTFFNLTPGLAAGFSVRRQRGVSASAAMTTPDVVEDASCPGLYRLLMDEDMTIASGKATELMTFYITHASLGGIPIVVQVMLYDVITADAVKMNGSPVIGSGTSGDKWRGS